MTHPLDQGYRHPRVPGQRQQTAELLGLIPLERFLDFLEDDPSARRSRSDWPRQDCPGYTTGQDTRSESLCPLGTRGWAAQIHDGFQGVGERDAAWR